MLEQVDGVLGQCDVDVLVVDGVVLEGDACEGNDVGTDADVDGICLTDLININLCGDRLSDIQRIRRRHDGSIP